MASLFIIVLIIVLLVSNQDVPDLFSIYIHVYPDCYDLTFPVHIKDVLLSMATSYGHND